MVYYIVHLFVFLSSRRRHTSGALVTGVQTCALPISLSDNDERADVVRIVRGESGRVEMRMELALRFNYGQAVPWVRRRDYGLSAIAGPDAVELHTSVAVHGQDMKIGRAHV